MDQIEFDYRSVLKQELSKRQQRNPSYSMRSFARDLKITSSRLNEALNRKKGLSVEKAHLICDQLGFSPQERELFTLSVEAQHGRSQFVRERSRKELKQLHRRQPNQVSHDIFTAISNWTHFAILELSAVEGFQSTPEWISKRLGIGQFEAEETIERLLRMGLAKIEDGQLRPTNQTIASPNDIPSDGLKTHHGQFIEKAKSALHLQAVQDREFQSLTLAFPVERMSEAKDMIRSFIHEFNDRFSTPGAKQAVYALTSYFYRLDQVQSGEGTR